MLMSLPLRSLPWTRAALLGDALHFDVDLSGPPLDKRISAIALVVKDVKDADATPGSLIRMRCDEGRVLRELPRSLFDAAHRSATDTAELTLHVPVPRAEFTAWRLFAVQVCARIAGTLVKEPESYAHVVSLEEEAWEPASDTARIATPSGEELKEIIGRGHAVLSFDPARGAIKEAHVRALQPRTSRTVTLRLQGGRKLEVPAARRYWVVGQSSAKAAVTLAAGDALLDSRLRPIPVLDLELSSARPARTKELEVDGSGFYFIDGLLAAGSSAAVSRSRDRKRAPALSNTPSTNGAPPAEHDEASEEETSLIAAPMSWDCQLSAVLKLDRELPAELQDIEVVVAPHHGAPGSRVVRSCNSGKVLAKLSRELLTATRQAPWRRADEPISFGLTLTGEALECDGGYDLLPCARKRDRTLVALAKSARFGRAGASCLAEGTPIDTPHGPLPIESLQIGQELRAWDVERGAETTTRVMHVVARADQPVATLRFSDQRELRATAAHLFWVIEKKEWQRASEIAIGATLLRQDGTAVQLISRTAFDALSTVYDVSVSAPHNYFAGGILVHNY